MKSSNNYFSRYSMSVDCYTSFTIGNMIYKYMIINNAPIGNLKL